MITLTSGTTHRLGRRETATVENSKGKRGQQMHVRRWAAGLLLIVATASRASPLAETRLFVCTDAQGHTLSADRPPPECKDREIRELRSDGSVRRVIQPPLTPAQRAQQEDEARARREKERAQLLQQRVDRALLATYASEADIDRAEATAIDGQRAALARAENRVKSLRAERRKLDSEAEFYQSRAQPEKLKAAYRSNDDMLKMQQKVIDESAAEVKRIEERFRVERARYRAAVEQQGADRK